MGAHKFANPQQQDRISFQNKPTIRIFEGSAEAKTQNDKRFVCRNSRRGAG